MAKMISSAAASKNRTRKIPSKNALFVMHLGVTTVFCVPHAIGNAEMQARSVHASQCASCSVVVRSGAQEGPGWQQWQWQELVDDGKNGKAAAYCTCRCNDSSTRMHPANGIAFCFMAVWLKGFRKLLFFFFLFGLVVVIGMKWFWVLGCGLY